MLKQPIATLVCAFLISTLANGQYVPFIQPYLYYPIPPSGFAAAPQRHFASNTSVKINISSTKNGTHGITLGGQNVAGQVVAPAIPPGVEVQCEPGSSNASIPQSGVGTDKNGNTSAVVENSELCRTRPSRCRPVKPVCRPSRPAFRPPRPVHRPRPAWNPPKPVWNKPKPIWNKPKPIWNKPKPIWTPPKPIWNKPKPVWNPPKPIWNKPKPVWNPPKPIWNKPKPIWNKPKPIWTPPKPIWNKPKPIWTPPKPIWNKPKPVWNPPKPIWNKPKPIWNKPKPVWNPPKPIWNKPKPVWTPPKPVWNPPKPIWNKPKPIWTPPKPIWNKPKPVWNPPKPIWNKPKPIWTPPKPVWTPPKPIWTPPNPVWSPPKPRPPVTFPPTKKPSIPSGNMRIVVNSKSNIIALLNQRANIGIAFDFTTNIVFLMTGSTGDMIIIDAQSRVGYRLIGQKSRLFWMSAKTSFEQYIQALPPLRRLLPFAVQDGTQFRLDSPDRNILQVVAQQTMNFGVKIDVDIKRDYSNALEVLIKPVSRLNIALQNAQSHILRQFQQSVTAVSDITLGHFVDVFERLPTVVNRFAGGISTFINKKIQLDLNLICKVKSGIKIVEHVIDKSTAAGVSVVNSVNGFSINSLFETIASISGPASVGYGAYVRAVGLLIGLGKGTVQIQPFIDALIKLSVSNLPPNAFQQLTSQLQHLVQSMGKLPRTPEVLNTKNDIRKLISGQLVIGNIDVSKIITILSQAGRKSPLKLVTNVLVSIKTAVDVSTSIPSFLLCIMTQLRAGLNYQSVYKLFPNVRIDDNLVASGHFFQKLLANFNYGNMGGSGFNNFQSLQNVPIVGDIVKAIGTQLNVSSNGGFNLNTLQQSAGTHVILQKITYVMGMQTSTATGVFPG